MNEYKVKMRVPTGNILPPYYVEGIEVYEAMSATQAIEKAKVQYAKLARNYGISEHEHPLHIKDISKL